MALLPIAEEYQVECLKSKCVELLMSLINESMSVQDICRYLEYALQYNLEEVKNKCVFEAGRKSQSDMEDVSAFSQLPLELQLQIQTNRTSRLSAELEDVRFRLIFVMNEPNKSVGMSFQSGNATSLATSLCLCLENRAAMGLAAAAKIEKWSFREDIEGLRQALASFR